MTRMDTPESTVSTRGGAPVGRLADLPPVEALAVLSLRLWCCDPDGQARMARDLCHVLPPDHAVRLAESFAQFCDLCVSHGRRPLMHHHLSCACLGADEAWFAAVLGAASEAAREDAVMLAATFLRLDAAFALWPLAAEVALGLRRATLRMDGPQGSGTMH